MNDIKSLQSTLIMIFPADDINLSSIKRKESIKLFEDRYNFELNKFPGNLPIPQNNIIFSNGEFKIYDKIFIINEMIIEERRIIIRCLGPSEIIDDFFKHFRKDLINMDLRDNKGDYAPILSTYETICVCRLNFDFSQTLSDRFNNYIADIHNDIQNFSSKMSIIPTAIRIRIEYFDLPDKIRKERITLNEKYLTIEQREKTDPDDRIFYVSSPTKTETHLKLIEKLESYLNK